MFPFSCKELLQLLFAKAVVLQTGCEESEPCQFSFISAYGDLVYTDEASALSLASYIRGTYCKVYTPVKLSFFMNLLMKLSRRSHALINKTFPFSFLCQSSLLHI